MALGKRNTMGNHWIAIGIYLKNVFICDSLGGLLPDKTFPHQLVKFLHRLLFQNYYCLVIFQGTFIYIRSGWITHSTV